MKIIIKENTDCTFTYDNLRHERECVVVESKPLYGSLNGLYPHGSGGDGDGAAIKNIRDKSLEDYLMIKKYKRKTIMATMMATTKARRQQLPPYDLQQFQ